MSETSKPPGQSVPDVSGLKCLVAIASHYRIPADAAALGRELALGDRAATLGDIVRASRLTGLRSRILRRPSADRLAKAPKPAIVQLQDGTFAVLLGRNASAATYRLVDVTRQTSTDLTLDVLMRAIRPLLVLVARKAGVGVRPERFGFRWFLSSIWRYRVPLGHVVVASLFIQLFALVTPLFFQVVLDKVLVHKTSSTLIVLTVGLVALGVFEALMQFLRTYLLAHTSNRIDVELGARLFHHLLRLPLEYFETRPAGQTVARIREVETIRTFLTGQGIASAMDLLFTVVFIAVLFLYSTTLTLVVLATIPLYVLVATLARPVLKELVGEKFSRGAESQQFLVEAVVGAPTLKASGVEPVMQAKWEDKLAAYVRTSFDVSLVAAVGQNVVQAIGRISTAVLLFFGAQAVIAGDLSVGGLIAFNMIAAQVLAPVLRLSQLWQDFQQVQVSVERLGDILNHPAERSAGVGPALPAPAGAIELQRVSFRYRPGSPDVLKELTMEIRAGETVGIVGPSGSGKSTLAKLIQRFYLAGDGRVLLDGMDVSHLDPAWLRQHVGVVLQDNLLFKQSIHDNIALANPALPRERVIAAARLAGADEFISRLPDGYDAIVEERGSNFSGGQRQRIALARVLVTNPRILILDEATSALDYESERLIQSNMRHIARNRTVIIIAHRLSTVRECDRIIGLRDGRLVEIGTHDELLARPTGLYAGLWRAQAGLRGAND